ncbi:MAG: hypothetical protein R3E09_08700 [Novosphingobium sp.]
MREQAEQGFAGARQKLVFLHGQGAYPVDVVGVSRHQAELHEIAGTSTRAGQRHDRIAALILDEGKPYKKDTVTVAIEGRIVGALPAHLSTRYGEWLRKWQLSGASVQCDAVIVDRRDSGSGAGQFGVWLDIELPFKMTLT